MLQYVESWEKPISSCSAMAFCANMSTDLLEGLGDMSFVGMYICPKGILAFGDCKATKKDVLGNLYEDTNRGKIDKIFSNDHYVLGYTGNNDMLYQGKDTFLEDFFYDHIKKYSSWNDLMEFLLSILTRENYPDDYGISFLIGERNTHSIGYHDKYLIHKVTMKNHYMILEPNVVSNASYDYLLSIGHPHYTQWMKDNFSVPRSIDQMEASLPLIEKHIMDMDKKASYNPVGLPLKTLLFQ